MPFALAAFAIPAFGSTNSAHPDPVVPVVAALAVILIAAKLCGDVAVRLGQAPVIGELVAGLVLGNLGLFGVHAFESVRANPGVDLIARLGVLVLLFEVGLESTVGRMLKVGPSALLAALAGIIGSFGLGWIAARLTLPGEGIYSHLFLAGAICATSVGITARVLRDLGSSQTAEAGIILGAAVIDDVLGFMVLATLVGAVGALASGSELSSVAIGWMLGKAAAFLVISMVLGVLLSPRLFQLASRVRAPGMLLAAGLSFCFFLSWLAAQVGLAAIVGAFAAGLILEDLHYRDFTQRGEHGLEELIRPISSFLVPVFFVQTGMLADLRLLAEPAVVGLAAALIAASIAGKQFCGLGVVQRGVSRLVVATGMMPRGEFTLIFAGIGLGLSVGGRPVVSPAAFSAVVLTVLATSILTPIALRWSLGRASRRS